MDSGPEVDQSRPGDVAGMQPWTQHPDLLVAHEARQQASNQRARTTFKSSQRSCAACCCQQETLEGELSSLEGQPMAHVGPLLFASNRRMVNDDSSSISPASTNIIDRCCCRRWAHGNICVSITGTLFHGQRHVRQQCGIVDHKGIADGGIVSPTSMWTLAVRWSCA